MSFILVDDNFVAEHAVMKATLDRLARKIDNFQGPGILNEPDSISTVDIPVVPDGIPWQTPLVQPLVLSAPDTGGGFYKGDWETGSASIAGGTNNLNLPLNGMNDPTNKAVLVLNPAEDGSTNHAALNPSASNLLYGAGLFVGTTTETPPRDIAYWLGGTPYNLFLFPVTLIQTGGGAGTDPDPSTSTPGTFCTFTYTVTDLSGNVLGTSIPVQWARQFPVQMTAATLGHAYMDPATGQVKLDTCDEVPDSRMCPP